MKNWITPARLFEMLSAKSLMYGPNACARAAFMPSDATLMEFIAPCTDVPALSPITLIARHAAPS